MGFGKRPSTSSSAPPPPAPPPAPDVHGRQKVLPDAVWEGKTGDFLRELGFNPNDESNLVPNAASLNARIEQGRLAMDARHAERQRQVQTLLPGAQLRPFFLIPDPCWNGPTGTFLMTSLDLFPHDDWNVMFLAADERTAAVLDIALHPNGNIPALVQAAEKFMDEAQVHMNGARNEAAATGNFAGFHDAREDARDRVKTLAGVFARQIVEAWQRQAQARSA